MVCLENICESLSNQNSAVQTSILVAEASANLLIGILVVWPQKPINAGLANRGFRAIVAKGNHAGMGPQDNMDVVTAEDCPLT